MPVGRGGGGVLAAINVGVDREALHFHLPLLSEKEPFHTPSTATPSTSTQGHFVLSSVFAHLKKPRPLELSDRRLQLHGKIVGLVL